MPDTIVSKEPASQPAAPAQPAPAAAPAADYERTIAELKGQLAESQRAAEFWAGRSQTTAAAPPPAPEPEPEDDTDVLEAITTEGVKGFDELAAKRGFIKRSEVEQMIDSRTQNVTATYSKEQELYTQYPDLKDRNSDFFKATAGHYGTLVKGGTPQLLAMELAAEKAELQFMREGKLSPEKSNRESDRLARIAAQSGGSRSNRPAHTEDDDDRLDDDQKRICAAMGISEESYLKRAKAGIRMGGKTK